MSKKDYTSNWQSEMHETFCYWSYKDWCKQMQVAGFVIDKHSKAFTNDWIIKHRWAPVATLFSETCLEQNRKNWTEMEWPATHMILIGRK